MTDDDEKRARSVGGMHDDEDMPSDNEQEILDEFNHELDGKIKISKEVVVMMMQTIIMVMIAMKKEVKHT